MKRERKGEQRESASTAIWQVAQTGPKDSFPSLGLAQFNRRTLSSLTLHFSITHPRPLHLFFPFTTIMPAIAMPTYAYETRQGTRPVTPGPRSCRMAISSPSHRPLQCLSLG